MLTRAYLNASGAPRSLRYILRLSYLGIGIGALALMLALTITRGFERDISARVKSINSDAVITSPGNQLDSDSLRQRIIHVMGPYIKGVSGSVTRHVMLDQRSHHQVLFLRGISPEDETPTTSLAEKIIAPQTHTLPHILAGPKTIMIGASLARRTRICCGDTVTVYIPQPTRSHSVSLTQHTLTVTGIFSVGLDEYDSNAAYCSLDTMRILFPDITGVDQLAVSFKPLPPPAEGLRGFSALRAWSYYALHSVDAYYHRQLRKLKLLFTGLSVRGWQELYPELVASLTLEKYAMTIVLALIALVASMLMICLLFMFIQYKRNDIAILRAMGASSQDMYRIFRRLGMMIVIKAAGSGLLCAAAVGWWLETFRPITLPSIYIVTYLPAAVEPLSFFLIFLIILLLGYTACLIPLKQLRRMSVAGVLREG